MTDFAKRRALIRGSAEKRVLDAEAARDLPALALPHRAPPRLCQRLEDQPEPVPNQDLGTVWLDK